MKGEQDLQNPIYFHMTGNVQLSINSNAQQTVQVNLENQSATELFLSSSSPLDFDAFITYCKDSVYCLSQITAEKLWLRLVGAFLYDQDFNHAVRARSGFITKEAAAILLNSLPQLEEGLDKHELPQGFKFVQNTLLYHPPKNKRPHPLSVKLIQSRQIEINEDDQKPVYVAEKSSIKSFFRVFKKELKPEHALLSVLEQTDKVFYELLAEWCKKYAITTHIMQCFNDILCTKGLPFLNDIMPQLKKLDQNDALEDFIHVVLKKMRDPDHVLDACDAAQISQWLYLKQRQNRYHWWKTLVDAHLKVVPDEPLDNLFLAFNAFSEALNEMGLHYPAECRLQHIKNMPTVLSHMHAILKNAKRIDKAEQWRVMQDLDLSGTGAILAVRSTASSRFVLPEMKYTSERYEAEYKVSSSNKQDEICIVYRLISKKEDQLSIRFYTDALAVLNGKNLLPIQRRTVLRQLIHDTTDSQSIGMHVFEQQGQAIQVFKDYVDIISPNMVTSPVWASAVSFYNRNETPARLPELSEEGSHASLDSVLLVLTILKDNLGAAVLDGIMKASKGTFNDRDQNGADFLDLISRFRKAYNEDLHVLSGSIRFISRDKRESFSKYENILRFVKVSELIDSSFDDSPAGRCARILLLENISTFKLETCEGFDREYVQSLKKLNHVNSNSLAALRSVMQSFGNNNQLHSLMLKKFIEDFCLVSDNNNTAIACVLKYFINNFNKDFDETSLHRIFNRVDLPQDDSKGYLKTFKDHDLSDDHIKILFSVIKQLWRTPLNNGMQMTRMQIIHTIKNILEIKEMLSLKNTEFNDFIQKLSLINCSDYESLKSILANISALRSLGPFYYIVIRIKQMNADLLRADNVLHIINQFYLQMRNIDFQASVLNRTLSWEVMGTFLLKYKGQDVNEFSGRLYGMLSHYIPQDIKAPQLIVQWINKVIPGSDNINVLICDLTRFIDLMSFKQFETLILNTNIDHVFLKTMLSQLGNLANAPLNIKLLCALAFQQNNFNVINREKIECILSLQHSEENVKVINEIIEHLPFPLISDISVNNSGVLVFNPLHVDPYSVDFGFMETAKERFRTHDGAQHQAFHQENLSKLKKAISDKNNESMEKLVTDLSGSKTTCDDHNLLASVLTLLHRSTKIELNEMQILTVYACMKGKRQIGQVATSEGKSRIMMVLATCKALQKKTVDLVTADMSLARRDLQEYTPFFKSLQKDGQPLIATGLIYAHTDAKSGYHMGGINLSDTTQLSLFRNRLVSTHNIDQGLDPNPTNRCVLGDEFDMLFLDNQKRFNHANVIANKDNSQQETWIYDIIVRYMMQDRFLGFLKIVNQDTRVLNNFEGCYNDFLEWIIVDPVATEYKNDMKRFSKAQLRAWFAASATAFSLKEGQHFVKELDQIILTHSGVQIASRAVARIDARLSRDSHYSFGVHQFIHAWLNVRRDADLAKGKSIAYLPYIIETERDIVYSTDTHQFFEQYDDGDLIGLSGTLGNSAEREEMTDLLNCSWFEAPRHKENRRVDEPIQLVETKSDKFKSILDSIMNRTSVEPVLVICADDTEVDRLYTFLATHLKNKRFIQKVDASCSREQEVKATIDAGMDNMITLSTKMMGRGTHINVTHAQGLRTILTHFPSTRDMYQAFGRSGRYGHLGFAQMILSKAELKAELSINSLNVCENNPISFYYHPEKFIEYHQMRLTQRHSVKRLISEMEMSYRKRIEDSFFFEKRPAQHQECWVRFLRGMDQLWAVRQGMMFSQIDQHRDDINAYLRLNLDQYNAQVTLLWNETFGELLPFFYSPQQNTSSQDKHFKAANKAVNRDITKSLKHNPLVHERYRQEFGGRMVIYSELFSETKSFFRTGVNQRRLFDNYLSWSEGHGILFSNTRALLNGEREIFANTRAYLRTQGWKV